MTAFLVVPRLIWVSNSGGVIISLDVLIQNEVEIVIDKTDHRHTNSPCKNKHHPKTDYNYWHPSS